MSGTAFSPAVPAAPHYVGSDACRQCHAEAFDAWQESDHGKAMAKAAPSSVLGDFDDVTVKFHDIETHLSTQGERLRVTTLGADGGPATWDIAYSFGHYPLQQYLVDIGNGHLQALNVAWDSRDKAEGGQRWYHLREETIDPEHAFFWTRHFQNANSRCIECHSTGFEKGFDAKSDAYETRWSEPRVGCEACHGPASRHVDIAARHAFASEGSGFERTPGKRLGWIFRGDDAIATPTGTPDASLVDTCGGCHSRRSAFGDPEPQAEFHQHYRLALLDRELYFADGQIDDEVFVLGSFLQSKMYRQGVTCENCHDAHSGKTLADGNALCAQCHKPVVFDSATHHRHSPGTPGAQCVACHMPATVYMQVDARRDHSFSVPDPWTSRRLGVPNACTGCHVERDDAWAISAMSGWGVEGKVIAWAQANHGLAHQDILELQRYLDNSSHADLAPIRQASLLARLDGFPMRPALDAASRNLNHPNPLLRRAAVSALRPYPAGLRWQTLNALIEDPVRSVRFEVAEILADLQPQLQGPDAERLQRLLDEYRDALRFRADTPGGQLALGILEFRLGYAILAERAYQRALDIEPGFVPALINLADLYRSMGSDGEAREILQSALRIAPDSATVNHAWGLYLVRAGQAAQALDYLSRALEQQDAAPRHAYVYAVALDSAGRTADAIVALEAASRRWPNTLELYYLQVSYMDRSGQTDGIRHYLGVLSSAAGNNPQIRGWVKKYGLDDS